MSTLKFSKFERISNIYGDSEAMTVSLVADDGTETTFAEIVKEMDDISVCGPAEYRACSYDVTIWKTGEDAMFEVEGFGTPRAKARQALTAAKKFVRDAFKARK